MSSSASDSRVNRMKSSRSPEAMKGFLCFPLHPHPLLDMLILLLLYYLGQGAFSGAVPLPSTVEERRTASTCNDLHTCRTVWNIIWSCLVTIFSCTWVAIHPNVPYPGNKKDMGRLERWVWDPLRSFISHRLPLFICALLVPEYILSWAIRQSFVAGQIAKDNKGWTKTHGFFVIMGGFHLFRRPAGEPGQNVNSFIPNENDIPLHPLSINALRDGEFEYTMPTEKEIKDRGKSNWLAKALVLVQTMWFVMQCIARGIRHLPVTELEIVTLAYATMSFGIYLFWWDKPLNVGCPIRVFATTDSQGVEEKAEQTVHKMPGVRQWLLEWKWDWDDVMSWLVRMCHYIIGDQDRDDDMLAPRVPTFWSGYPTANQGKTADGITLMVGIIFGAIHCIAWSFEFPSHTELVLWRISSVGIIATPAYFLVGFSFAVVYDPQLPDWVQVVIILPLLPLLYIVARAATVVLAFTSLRALPSAAYETVYWTTFIPHI